MKPSAYSSRPHIGAYGFGAKPTLRRGFALSGYPPEADGRTAGVMSARLNTPEIYLSTAPPESAQSLKPPRL